MKRKAGFTLSELLIMLVVIGVIVVLTIGVNKSQETKFALNCYHFFHDLQITIGHMVANSDNGTLNSTATEDGETYNYANDSDFCKALAKNLSSAGTVKCADGDLYSATIDSIYNGISGTSAPNFRLMNKYSVYVSKRVSDENETTTNKTGIWIVDLIIKPTTTTNTQPGYRMIAVDLNGRYAPNTTDKDIIAFAIFDTGLVLPYGEAATNTDYFKTVIKIRNTIDRGSSGLDASGNETNTTAIDAIRHPAVIIKSNGNALSFKDGYCKVMGQGEEANKYDRNYCSGYTDFSDSVVFGGTTYDLSKCESDLKMYSLEGELSYIPYTMDCSFNIIKPQVSKFIPILQDVYSSKNNDEDTTEINKDAWDQSQGHATVGNQIYKW